MKKTLVIVAHPDIARSTVNHTWARALAAQEDRYTVHELYAAYPDGKINVAAEQALIEAHGSVILQFPVYWFSCPPLLKQWFDSVFTHGWAFGSSATVFKGRKLGLAVSHGTPPQDYSHTGKTRHTLAETLVPFEIIAHYIGAEYLPPFTFHALEFFTEEEIRANRAEMTARAEQSAQDLLAHLEKLA